MATALKVGAIGMRQLIYPFFLLVACLGCARYDTKEYDELLKIQPMIFFHETGEHRVNHQPGFVIYMKPAEANKRNAPNSQEFQKLLDDQLAVEEKKNGRPFCEKGYRIVDDYTYYFRKITAECNY